MSTPTPTAVTEDSCIPDVAVADIRTYNIYELSGIVTGCARPQNRTWEFAALQVEMIQDELNEMKLAIEEKNVDEFYDGAHDVIFLTSAFAYLHNHDYKTGYNTMCEALFSRFDKTPEDCDKTMQKYADLGVKTYFKIVGTPFGDRWVTYVAESIVIGKENYPKDKWLKSHAYHKPDYTGQLPVLYTEKEEL